MKAKNVLITGGTSGLGREMAGLFRAKGYNVRVTGRNKEKAVVMDSFVYADFADLSGVRMAAKTLTADRFLPDIIINNAGTLGPSSYSLTNDGFEYTYQVNFIAHYLLNDLLLEASDAGKEILLVFVTSPVFRFVKPDYRLPEESDYSVFQVYAESKYYLLLTGAYLAEKYTDRKIRILNFSPGVFGSGIFRMRRPFYRAVYSVAQPFMPGPGKPARRLAELIDNELFESHKVYRKRSQIREHAPCLNDRARDFLLSLEKTVNLLR